MNNNDVHIIRVTFLLQVDIFKPSLAPNLLEQVFMRCACVLMGIKFLEFIADALHIRHCKYCKFELYIHSVNFLELLFVSGI